MSSEEARLHYKELFDLLERTLLEQASAKFNDELKFDPAKVEYRRSEISKDHVSARRTKFDRGISNTDLWRLISSRPFYANRPSLEVNKKIDHMLTHLEQPEVLCKPEWDPPVDGKLPGIRFQEFLDDKECRKEKARLKIVVNAARNILKRVDVRNGKPWIEVLIPHDINTNDQQDTSRIIKRMRDLFGKGWGSITSFHLMTDLGLPVVKPDIVLTQISARLGIIREYEKRIGSDSKTMLPVSHRTSRSQARILGKNKGFQNEIQKIYQSIANDTDRTIRELDFIVVKLGQEVNDDTPYVRQICGETPRCDICYASTHCLYAQRSRRRR